MRAERAAVTSAFSAMVRFGQITAWSLFERSSLGFLAAAVLCRWRRGVLPLVGERRSRCAGRSPAAGPRSAGTEPLSARLGRRALAGFDLEAVAAGAPVPRIGLAGRPTDGATVAGGKSAVSFHRAILPLALLVNEEVLAQRTRLWAIRQLKTAAIICRPEAPAVAQGRRRAVRPRKADDLAELTRRIDAVPPSILIAAAALSTRWKRWPDGRPLGGR